MGFPEPTYEFPRPLLPYLELPNIRRRPNTKANHQRTTQQVHSAPCRRGKTAMGEDLTPTQGNVEELLDAQIRPFQVYEAVQRRRGTSGNGRIRFTKQLLYP